MVEAFSRQRGHVLAVAAVIACVLLYLALGVRLALVQNVWIDESTQLLGSALPFGRMIAWLAGHHEPLGVPGDRMPPVSYLIDWSWLRVAGADLIGLRLLHLAIAAAGVAATAALAARRYGKVAALVTGLLLAANPNLVTVGVELRAYPIFVAVTALQLWLVDGLLRQGATPARLGGLLAASVLASYVHFFGLVSSCALLSGIAAVRYRSGPTLVRVGAVGVALIVMALGLAPFIGGARAISDDAPVQASLLDALEDYLPRIYGHSAMLLHPLLTTILFVAFATLIVVAIVRACSRAETFELAGVVLVALAAGLLVGIAAKLVVHGFDPMKPSYSIWMVPLLALAAGSACAPGGRVAVVARSAAAVALATLLPTSVAFAQHADWFVHGPEQALAEVIGADPAATALVYVGDTWGYGYFPLVRRYRGQLRQYRLDANGGVVPLRLDRPQGAALPASALNGARQVLLVAIDPRTGTDLRHWMDGQTDAQAFASPEGEIAGWHPVETIVRPGLYWLRLTRMERE